MLDHDPEKQLQTQIDDLLESLLSRYSSAEPRPGLEKRILANLRQAKEPKPRFWMQPWLLGAAAALAILLVVVFSLLRPARPSHFEPIRASKPETPPRKDDIPLRFQVGRHRPIARTELAAASIRKVGDGAQDRPLRDRPAIFPTPVPLSEQEGFMFLYLANTPKEELIAQGRREEEKDDGFWDDNSRSSSGPQPSGHIR
jgi:hypothetical protein